MIRERLRAHCDHCDGESQQHTCHEALLRNLRHNAWYVDARVMLCPDCYEFAVGWQQRIDSVADLKRISELKWADIAAFVTSVQPMEEEE